MSASLTCPQCGTPLRVQSTQGICPACLMKAGIASQPGSEVSASSGFAETMEHVPGSSKPMMKPDDARLPEPGDLFGNYRIVRTLGKGGMGAVFEADQLESGRRVALKVLKHSLDSQESRRRFLREGKLAASINHPNSVYVYGTEEIEGTPAISMELVAGGTLQDRVKYHGPLPIGEAVDVILQIITGLEAAQKLGVLHRDIKPANCFIDADGSVKVGDFGLSISTAARGDTDVTQMGTFLGTPAFSSPEQLRGDELNVRSDMYAVGVTLYFLLTGRTPFEADNVVKLLATVLESKAPSPQKHRKEIPAGLASVVLRCLQKQPTDRFRDYAELRRALQPFASASPTPATLGLRWLAYVVDYLLLAWMVAAIQFSLLDIDALTDPQQRGAQAIVMLACLALWLGYYAIPEGLWGLTPGRALCRLRVVGPDGTAPGIARALLRAAIFIIPANFPMWARHFAVPDGGVSYVVAALSWGIFLGLFVTARRRNGYAGLHELASRTRVISYEAYQARPSLATADELPAVADNLPQIGPYHVLKELSSSSGSQWLLGYDTRLLRRVWIRKVPTGSPPVSASLRGLGRVGRLRWLNSRRSPSENWDAYEAVPGQPLMSLLDQRHPWREVRFWLLDLTEELAVSARDGNSPNRLSPDQVWITSDGRAKLLDFPAPGVTPLPEKFAQPLPPAGDPAASRILLDQVASSSLEGRTPRLPSAPAAVPAVPLPMKARQFFASLPALASLDAIALPLRELVRTTAEVTLGRRLTLLLALLLPGLVICALGIGTGRVYERMLTKHPEVQPLLMHLIRLDDLKRNGWHGVMEHQGGPALPEEVVLVEKYIAHRFGPVVRDREQWSSAWAKNALKPEMRATAERIVAEYPHVTDDEFQAAEKLVGPLMGILGAPNFRPLGDNSLTFFVVAAAVGWMMWMGFFSPCAAVLCRGGLLMWALGLTFVRSDGKPASRLRVLWRTIVAWSPLVLIFLVPAFVMPAIHAGEAMSAEEGFAIVIAIASGVGVFCLALVVWSLLLPVRGIPDRIAGTWPVPR